MYIANIYSISAAVTDSMVPNIMDYLPTFTAAFLLLSSISLLFNITSLPSLLSHSCAGLKVWPATWGN